MKPFIREKKIQAGANYREADLIMATDRRANGRRQKKQNISRPAQRNLNDENSKRYFVQLAEANFGAEDWAVELSYFAEPDDLDAADRDLHHFIARLRYLCRKRGLPPLKWLAVTSDISPATGRPARVHHHLFVSGVLSFDDIRNAWRQPRRKGEKQGRFIGRVNLDRLIPDQDFNISGKAHYFGRQTGSRRKRWRGALHLTKPVRLPDNDHRYSRRQIERLALAAPYPAWGKDVEALPHADFWRKQYPGWRVVSYQPRYNDFSGWAIYLKMRRVE